MINIEKLKKSLKGRPPRGKYTFLRRFLQLSLLTLFTTQALFHGYFIEGSFASSKTLLDLALSVFFVIASYHFWKATLSLSKESGKVKYLGLIGGSLATIGAILALYSLFTGLGLDVTAIIRVGTKQEPKEVLNYTGIAAWITFILGGTLYLGYLWRISKEGAGLLKFSMNASAIFLAMAVVTFLITENLLVVLGSTAAVAAAISFGLYAEEMVTKDERIKRLAYALGITSIALGVLTLVSYFVSLKNVGTFYYPMMDPIAWIEYLAASRGFTLESVIAVLVVVFLYSVLGRFFCGWVCPMDLLFSIFEKKLNMPRDPPQIRFHKATTLEKVVPIAFALAYVVLSYVFAMPFFTNMSPVAGTTKFGAFVVAVLANVPAAFVGSIIAYGYTTLFALVVNVIAEKVFKIKRFWCRFVCPIGALYGFVMNKYSPLRIRIVNEKKCTRCNLCSMACPMSIDIVDYINRNKDIDDYRCFHCGRCVEVCPYGVLSLSFFKKEEK
ncbi:polyferredoxin [Ignicoccus islandicus DSM 13165]|uniref:Polyferredoxin n=1 Tax=Ignicoccus islandicus DSM 13165 TaxID=940295 RepID=A0A0U3E0I7_9CREN|nr:4Fe-4S binding protein [Ignicoccus islandicus]ALU11419.1 polyferredoxin [Ignicoccus islandicus DSM 13165]